MDVTAKCVRSDGWWAIEVPEVKGVFSQARRLDQVDAMVSDAVGLALDIDPATVKVSIEYDSPEVDAVRIQQEQAQHAAEEAQRAVRSLVTRLQADGYTIRDIGTMLEVSPQRVQQLSKSA